MGSKIDISVIIPMYNAEKYIKDTINSVLLQATHTFTYEIIIVDDNSMDNSCAIVKKINHPQIILTELKKNAGISNARNVGLRIAQGEWIQFLDSDDLICNDLFHKFEHDKKPGLNCYLFSIEHIHSHHTLRQIIQKIQDKRAFGHFGSVCNKFIKKELCVEFKENYLFEDTMFIIDVFIQKELHLGLIDDSFYIYNRNNPNSIITNFKSKEFYKMFRYVYCQIDKCDKFTKMFILETFMATATREEIDFFIKMKIIIKTLLKLYMYLPSVIFNQNRSYVENIRS